MRTLDTIQLNRQKLNLQSYPKPKKQFVCLYGSMIFSIIGLFSEIGHSVLDYFGPTISIAWVRSSQNIGFSHIEEDYGCILKFQAFFLCV